MIFNLYLQGKSFLGIVKELERMRIKSPTGKATWPMRTIDALLSNEKYTGNVRLLDDGKHGFYYKAEGNNAAIIYKETFQAVKLEKQHRSNVTQGEEGTQRKSKKYSSKN